jgi:hypothetical protein
MMRRWQADGSVDKIFSGTVPALHQDQLLDLSVIHGDGTTTAAKKGVRQPRLQPTQASQRRQGGRL